MSGTLIQSSAILNTTTQSNTNTDYSVSSAIVQPVDAMTDNLACPAIATTAGISNAASAITNNAINTAEFIAADLVDAAVSTATSAVVNTVLGITAAAENSAVGFLTANAAAIANKVASSVGNLFNNTLASIGTNVKIPIPDPIASSFGRGVPQSSLFATNSILSQMDAVTLGTLGAIANAAAGILNTVNQAEALLAYGVNTAAKLEQAIQEQLGQLAAIAAYGEMSNLVTLGPADPTAPPIEGGTCPTASYSGYSDYATLASPIALALTGSATGLASMYNPYLPNTATETGTLIPGIPQTAPASVINQIINTLSNTLNVSGITVAPSSYAATQSLFDGLFAISAQLGLVAVVNQMVTASMFSDSTKAQARALLEHTTNNPSLIAALLSAGGAENINLDKNWHDALIVNPNLTSADIGTVESILTATGETTTTAFAVKKTSVDATTIPSWNADILVAANSNISSGLLATSPLSYEGALAASLSTTGCPPAASIGLMARGVQRTLNTNLQFTSLQTNTRTVVYGSIASPL